MSRAPEDRESALARAVALSQVGLEMAAPIGVGYLLDLWLGSAPWLTVTGAVFGLVGGLWHLTVLLKVPPGPPGGASDGGGGP